MYIVSALCDVGQVSLTMHLQQDSESRVGGWVWGWGLGDKIVSMKKGFNPCAHSDDLQPRLSSEECSPDLTTRIPVWRKWENSHFGWRRKGNESRRGGGLRE